MGASPACEKPSHTVLSSDADIHSSNPFAHLLARANRHVLLRGRQWVLAPGCNARIRQNASGAIARRRNARVVLMTRHHACWSPCCSRAAPLAERAEGMRSPDASLVCRGAVEFVATAARMPLAAAAARARAPACSAYALRAALPSRDGEAAARGRLGRGRPARIGCQLQAARTRRALRQRAGARYGGTPVDRRSRWGQALPPPPARSCGHVSVQLPGCPVGRSSTLLQPLRTTDFACRSECSPLGRGVQFRL